VEIIKQREKTLHSTTGVESCNVLVWLFAQVGPVQN